MKPLKPIQVQIDYSEPIQFLEEFFSLDLDNGYTVNFIYKAEIIIAENLGYNYYEENQTSVKTLNPEIEILDVWDEDDLILLSDSAEKELKQELLKWIE